MTIIHLPSGLSLWNSDLKRHHVVLLTLLHCCDFNEKKISPSSFWSEANEKTHAGAADPIQLSLNPSPASPADYSEPQRTHGREKEMFAVISCWDCEVGCYVVKIDSLWSSLNDEKVRIFIFFLSFFYFLFYFLSLFSVFSSAFIWACFTFRGKEYIKQEEPCIFFY